MEKSYKLDELKAKEIFDRDIIPYIFSSATPVDNPKFIMVGGQPGSGKTALVIYNKNILDNNYISVDGDLLRRFHPDYINLHEKYGADSSKYTHPDCARWSIWAIKKARSEGYNVILENTLRDKNILNTITEFKKKDYDIYTKIMVVSDLESGLGLFQRYFDMLSLSKDRTIAPRYTSKQWHDETANNLPNTIEAIEKQGISSIELYRRSTDGVEKIAIPRNTASFKELYLEVKDYPYTKEELIYIKNEMIRIKKLLDIHISSIECLDDFKSLEEEAKTISF